jgi:polysaccharide export outer membrane protein
VRNVLTHFLNLLLLACLSIGVAHAQQQRAYLLGAGDVIRITVFQNPDMQTDTRVSDLGHITFPLIGNCRWAAARRPRPSRRSPRR